jgi:hypothetical protein
MRRSPVRGVLGAFAGYVVSKLFCTLITPMPFLPPELGTSVFTLLVAAFGAWAGYRGGPVARWSAATATLLGLAGFAYGVVAVASRGDLSLGVLVGLYGPGPFGAMVGALIGAVIGFVREKRSAKKLRPAA